MAGALGGAAAGIRDSGCSDTEEGVQDRGPRQGHHLRNAHPSVASIFRGQKVQTNAAAGWCDLIFSRECYYCVF